MRKWTLCKFGLGLYFGSYDNICVGGCMTHQFDMSWGSSESYDVEFTAFAVIALAFIRMLSLT